MKKIYYLIILLSYSQLLKSQVPNASFENWTSGNPDNWYANNIPPVSVPITQVTPGNSGTYSAKGQPVILTTGDTLGPVLTAGPSGAGFSVTQRYSALEFYYKLNLVPGDELTAVAVIYDASHGAIASGALLFTSNSSGFIKGTIPFSYLNGNPAAIAVINFVMGVNFATGRNYPSPSSYFIIDDVALTGIVAGIQEINSTSELLVFPNPAQDHLIIKGLANNDRSFRLVLTDAAGRIVIERNSTISATNFIADELNLQGIAPGFYSLALIGEKETLVRRIVIQ